MPIIFAYWSVVLIWSTTPLGVAASNDSLTFWSAAGLRMIVALTILMIIVWLRKKPLFVNKRIVLSYGVAAICFGPQMSLVYWAAQHVPTGVVSIVFALSPCMTCIASAAILRDTRISLQQGLALVVALIGMGFIYFDKLSFSSEADIGLAALLLSVIIFAVCSVILKRLTVSVEVDPICQAAGTLLFSVPLFAVLWIIFDGDVPQTISTTSLTAVLYLALFGSVMGSSLYFYIVRHLDIVKVSLITLITPLISVTIGAMFWGEPLTLLMGCGLLLVLASLVAFEGLLPKMVRYLRLRSAVKI